MRTKTCLTCNRPYEPTGNGQRFCSPECRPPRVTATAARPRDCRGCGEPISAPIANQQYCAGCKKSAKEPLALTCVRCGEEFSAYSPAQKFCSEGCRNHKEQPPKWTLNPNFEYKDSTWRKYVLQACGNVCVDCGEAKTPLHTHHVIPRARGGKNVVSNGMALCADCHRERHDPSQVADELVDRIAARVVQILDGRTSA